MRQQPRVVADGFLGQVLKKHIFLGGKDPEALIDRKFLNMALRYVVLSRQGLLKNHKLPALLLSG